MKSSIILYTTTSIFLISILLAFNHNSFSHHELLVLQVEHVKNIPIVGAVGPESFAFDKQGEGPYTGVSDGRIIKWLRNERRWIDFAVTSIERDGCGSGGGENNEHICGRPLGLCFSEKTGDLYVSDAYMGLIVVDPNGGLPTKLVTQVEGLSLRFTNGLDIDQDNGAVYFTDSSSLYSRRDYISVILSNDNTGRLIKYDSLAKQTNVLLSNLSFPNGVALSKNRDFLLVAETTKCRILRYWLDPNKYGTYEVFAELPGFPDNVKRNEKGEFWIGIHSRRRKVMEYVVSTFPWIGNALVNKVSSIFNVNKLLDIFSKWSGGECGLAMRLSEEGHVLEFLEGKTTWSISEVTQDKDGRLWIGSVNSPYAQLFTHGYQNQTSRQI